MYSTLKQSYASKSQHLQTLSCIDHRNISSNQHQHSLNCEKEGCHSNQCLATKRVNSQVKRNIVGSSLTAAIDREDDICFRSPKWCQNMILVAVSYGMKDKMHRYTHHKIINRLYFFTKTGKLLGSSCS